MVMVAVPSKTTNPPERRWRRNLSMVVVAVVILGIAKQNSLDLRFERLNSSTSSKASSLVSSSSSLAKIPNVHAKREIIHGVDVLFAEPPDDKVKGLFFVAHGCSHSNTDWFVGCEGCIGLPEERAIVQIGLDHGLVVVAVSSSDRVSKCWGASDIEPVGRVLQELSKRYQPAGSDAFRIFAFGASSGGSFVSGLATPLKERFGLPLSGFLSQIAARQTDESALCQVYITMNGDKRTDANAQELVRQATSSTIPARHIRVPPQPIRPTYFATRIPEITAADSSKMAASLQDAGLLDENGYLLESPRRSNWRDALKTTTPIISAVENDSLVADASPISEVMNVADGMHEMTRDGVKEALEFCLSAL